MITKLSYDRPFKVALDWYDWKTKQKPGLLIKLICKWLEKKHRFGADMYEEILNYTEYMELFAYQAQITVVQTWTLNPRIN